jgi:uncharacterized protein YbjT (DUF2867 family)
VKENEMITIMGASGKTGGFAAQVLLKHDQKVRVIARSKDHLKTLVDKGAEPAVGDAADAGFLAAAFRGSDAVYTLVPPNVAHPDVPAYMDQIGEATIKAIKDSGVTHVVFLSSIGADRASGTGPIASLHRQEQRLAAAPGLNVLALRPAYFFENHFMSLPLIMHQGINGSAMAGNYAFPQIATADIGAAAAQALRARDFKGTSVRELLGSRDLSLDEATRIMGAAIGKPDLKYVQFPYEAAFDAMVSAGLSKSMSALYVEMAKAFNEGLVQSEEGRNARNTTQTRFEDFVAHTLAPAYRVQ